MTVSSRGLIVDINPPTPGVVSFTVDSDSRIIVRYILFSTGNH